MHAREFNFSFWKDSIARDPDKAARCFFDRIKSLPEDELTASISSFIDESRLIESFANAADNLHRPLGGVPFFLKDLFDVAGYPTHCGSKVLPDIGEKPEKSCPLFKDITEEGAIYCGKTQMNEFAYGLDGLNPHYGDCPHPHFSDRLSGGSSSGSAWAVGKGITPLAFGTDTGGSIRVPASFCGIYGLRLQPKHKWVDEGCFPLAPTYDSAGWFTASAEDMKVCIETLLSPEHDNKKLRGLYFDDAGITIDSEVQKKYRQMADQLQLERNDSVENRLTAIFNNSEKYYAVLQSCEAYTIHSKWLDNQHEHYDPAVWQRINRGRYWKSAVIEEAEKQQEHIRNTLSAILKEYDYLVIPSVPCHAVRKIDLSQGFREGLLRLNTPASMAGYPVLTIPVYLPDGLSGGLQVIYADADSQIPINILDKLINSSD